MRIDHKQMRMSLIIVGLAVAYVGLLWWPVQNDIGALRAKIAKSEQELGIARDRTDGLAKLAEEVNRLRHEVAGSNKEVPAQSEMAAMLRELSVQIESENLTGQGINMLAAKAGEDYLTQPVELTFSGRSLDAFRFVNRLENMPRLVQVESVAMRQEPDSGGQRVKASLRLNTFFYTPEVHP